MPSDATRRTFLAASAAPLFVPKSAFGANDKLTYGLIACGSRARALHGAFQKIGAEPVALCDVYQPHLELARKMSPEGVKTYVDYHELLTQPGIDFVVIASPDHQHRPMLLASLAAKKDVYQEKPLSMTLAQSQEMVKAVRETKQVVQIGMQRRSMAFIHGAKKVIDERLGKVSIVKAMWNWHFDLPLSNGPLDGTIDWDRFLGPAPHRELEPKRFRWWRGFWDYSGGNMTDQGTHLMDVVQWMTGSGVPRSAVSNGQVQLEDCEVPNVFTAVFEYPAMIASWTLNYRTTHEFDWSITFQGEEAIMVMDRRGYRLYKNGPLSGEPWNYRGQQELLAEMTDHDKPEAHQQNFLDCVRSRQEPNCPIETAAAAVSGPHMANLSLREERKVKLGPDGLAV
jgi:predicted dehydrogenase